MQLGMRVVMASAIFAVACKSGEVENPKLEAAGNALLRSADECLTVVRRGGVKYDDTPSCTALSALAAEYIRIEVESYKFKEAPPKYALLFVKAQRSAWVARTMECPGGAASIW